MQIRDKEAADNSETNEGDRREEERHIGKVVDIFFIQHHTSLNSPTD